VHSDFPNALYKLRGTYSYHYTDMSHLTTGTCYDKCVVRRFCRCV